MEDFFWNDFVNRETEMTRQDANRKIIEILANVVEKFPDWRFCQMLQNLGIVEPGGDNFYDESEDTLNEMNENLIMRGIS